MKLGYCTWGMPTIPVDTFVPFLARLGYDGIELTVIPGYTTELSRLNPAERRRIARMLQDHHLELPAIAAQTSMVERAPDTAALHWARLTAAVDLAVEPHVGSMLDTPARALELLHTITSPYLKLNFDISHFNVLGIPIAESVAALAQHTVHTHVKDERGVVPAFEFLIPGEGSSTTSRICTRCARTDMTATSPPKLASWCSGALITIRWPPRSRHTGHSDAPLSGRGSRAESQPPVQLQPRWI